MHVLLDGFDGAHILVAKFLQRCDHAGNQLVRHGGTRGNTHGFDTFKPCGVKFRSIIHTMGATSGANSRFEAYRALSPS